MTTTAKPFTKEERQDLLERLKRGADSCAHVPAVCVLERLERYEATIDLLEQFVKPSANAPFKLCSVCGRNNILLDDLEYEKWDCYNVCPECAADAMEDWRFAEELRERREEELPYDYWPEDD